jgi:hypothetical protein
MLGKIRAVAVLATLAAAPVAASATTVSAYGEAIFNLFGETNGQGDVIGPADVEVSGGGLVVAKAFVSGTGGEVDFDSAKVRIVNKGPAATFVGEIAWEASLIIEKAFGEQEGAGGVRLDFLMNGQHFDGFLVTGRLTDGLDGGTGVNLNGWSLPPNPYPSECLVPGDRCTIGGADMFNSPVMFALGFGEMIEIEYRALAVAVVPIPAPAAAPLLVAGLGLLAAAGTGTRPSRRRDSGAS